jgi:hypothetical protein
MLAGNGGMRRASERAGFRLRASPDDATLMLAELEPAGG